MTKPRYLDEIEGSDVPHVPAGRYLAVLEGVEKTTTRFGDAFKWHWTLPNEDDFQLAQMTSTATSSGSNAGRIVRTLRGRSLAPGEKLSAGEITGQAATLELSVNPESGWNRVEDIQPVAPPLSDQTVESYADTADALGF